jgi:diguanylate cyclase (GGDEF)-like protein
VLDAAGECSGDVVLIRDITEQQIAAETLRARLGQIEALQEELREQAIRDPLTGMYNRRYLDETLERELGRAQREGYPVSLVMIDVDRFKSVNDTFGHATGDSVLRVIGDRLRAETRLGDMACRLGGDEFLVLLPNTAAEAAHARAEYWRRTIEDAVNTAAGGLGYSNTTISLGVASFPRNGHTAHDVLAAADAAVYAAKAAGRNRVFLAV